MPLPSLSMVAPYRILKAGLEDRTLSGVALPYGEIGRTSAGAVSAAAGSIRVPAELDRVKLFSEHGRTRPVGYATHAADEPAALSMSFRVAATPDGDTALLEAAEGVRDALSVELSDVTIRSGVIVSAQLDAVALVPLPAYPSARLVLAADTDPPPTAEEPAAGPAGSSVPETEELAEDLEETEGAEPSSPADASEPPGSDEPETERTAPVTASLPVISPAGRRPAATDKAALVARLSAAVRGATDAAQVNAALSDIVPGNDTSDGAFIRPQWVDELWTPIIAEQFFVNSVGSAPLTGMRVLGWKWTTRPVVGAYAGNKAEIPSNPVAIGPAEADAYRLAGGWDIDRVFYDLGDGSIGNAVLDMAAQDLATKEETAVGTALLAAAPDVSVAAGSDVFTAIGAAVSAVVNAGAVVSFVGLSSDFFADLLAPSTATAPWWLTGATVSLPGGTADLPIGVRVGLSPGLPAATVLAGDRRAFTHYSSAAIRVQALNVPNGGIDVALFHYAADLVHNAAGLAQVTVTAGP